MIEIVPAATLFMAAQLGRRQGDDGSPDCVERAEDEEVGVGRQLLLDPGVIEVRVP